MCYEGTREKRQDSAGFSSSCCLVSRIHNVIRRPHTHTHTHTHTQTHTHTYIHTHTYTHTHTHARTHARTHTHTHTRTHARTHAPPPTHTHTHTNELWLFSLIISDCFVYCPSFCLSVLYVCLLCLMHFFFN